MWRKYCVYPETPVPCTLRDNAGVDAAVVDGVVVVVMIFFGNLGFRVALVMTHTWPYLSSSLLQQHPMLVGKFYM